MWGSVLVKDLSNRVGVNSLEQGRPRTFLNTMDGPQHLLKGPDTNGGADRFSWMVGCKTDVVQWVPVLGGHNHLEAGFEEEPVYHRNDSLPVRDGKRSSRAEIILKIHQHQSRLCLSGRSVH